MITSVVIGPTGPGDGEADAVDDRDEVLEILDRIVSLADRRGFTQERLEEAAGLPRNRLSKWKRSGEPSARQLRQIAKTLGTTMEVFLEGGDLDAIGFHSEMDHILFLVKKLGAEEALYRLLGERHRPSAENPREGVHGQRVEENGESRRRKGAG